MKRPIENLGFTGIPVNYLADQLWCEQQVEFRLSSEVKPKVTKAMEKGKQTHQTLQEKISPPIEGKPRTKADWLYLTFHRTRTAAENLKQGGKAREVPIFGYIHSLPIWGRIDELRAEDGQLRVSETKTRQKKSSPRKKKIQRDSFQAMVYWRLLADIQRGKFSSQDFSSLWQVDFSSVTDGFLQDLRMKANRELFTRDLRELMDSTFRSLKRYEPLPRYEICYLYQESHERLHVYKFKFDSDEFDAKLEYLVEFWLGQRETNQVDDQYQWICDACGYRSICPKWNAKLSSFFTSS